MYNNPYYNSQANIDRINNQIAELEKMKNQINQPITQPTNLTQNFQIAPTNQTLIRYANSIEEVQKDMVIGETPFFSKDMSVVWVKNAKGDIKTYELTEIIPKDEKDMQIALLQSQIDELRKEMKMNEQINRNVSSTEDTTDTTEYDERVGEPIKESKPTSVQRVSTSKKGK